MSLPSWGLDRITTEALGWTLVHFLWQGALIAAILCTMDLLLARCRATVRYVTACLAFTFMLLVPVATFFLVRAEARNRPHATYALALPDARASLVAAPLRAPVARGATLAGPARSFRLSSLSRFLPWVVDLWTIGVVLFSLRLLGGWWLVRRLARSSANVTLEAWQSRLHDLAHRIGVSRPVRLCRSALVEVPTAVGWLRPMILLPATTLTGLAPAQIEAILAHELAHIRRHDYLVNLLQNLAEMLLFYHPAVWWVSRHVREERELCCDDLAIRVSGDPVAYARTLCELERLRGAAPDLALAASGGSLAARIARLLGLPRRESWTRGLAGAFGASAVLVLLAVGGLEVNPGRASAIASQVRAVRHEATVAVARSVAALQRPVAVARSVVPVAVATIEPAMSAITPGMSAIAPTMSAMAPAVAAIAPAVAAIAPAVSAITPTVAMFVPMAASMAGPVVTISTGPCPIPAPCPDKSEASSGGGPSDPARADRFSIDEWEHLRQHGIGSTYLRNLEPNLPGLTADELCALADHGVSSIYVNNLKRAGLERLSVDDLIRLAEHGVSSEYVGNLRSTLPEELTVDELIRLANNGVPSKWFSAMQWMGLSEFSVDRAIQLRNAGVTAEYANQLKLVTRRHLTLDELRSLRVQGVTADYAARMYVLLGPDLDVDDLVRLRNNGVSSEYAEQMTISVRAPLAVEDLIALRNQGVEPDFAYEMSVLGSLEPKDLIRLRQSGVSAEFLEQARAKGFTHVSVSDLIRLSQQGLPD